ncbi:MAG: hypothetical protein PHQ64_01155 [Bacilli bacterium]|nr:hypothetical protein [Bacilli bacterium]
MKNNKGFVISTIIYGLVMIICMIVLVSFGTIKEIHTNQESINSATKNKIIDKEYFYKDTSNASTPVLYQGMIPVVYDTSVSKWKKANLKEEWYDYNKYNWANAVTVKTAGTQTRSYYQNAVAGTIIPIEDINTMWVWIPRYEYKFTTTTLSEILINFTSNTTPTSGYTIHPAFTFNNKNLQGLWFSKFEVSGTISDLKIIPNVTSLSSTSVSNLFTASRNMESTYSSNYGFNGLEIDTHMMKNIEWGVVAYLSNSKYGKYGNPVYTGANKEIYLNNYYNSSTWATITGCSSGVPSTTGNTTSCSYTYEKENTGTGASSTGTIYGVYDLNGGKWEFTMGNMLNSGGAFYSSSAGFSAAPDIKYYDSYAYSTLYSDYATRGKIGDATKETVNWYSDEPTMPENANAWFSRGGNASFGTKAGTFTFSRHTGGVVTDTTTRIVITKE